MTATQVVQVVDSTRQQFLKDTCPSRAQVSIMAVVSISRQEGVFSRVVFYDKFLISYELSKRDY